jgi:O-antigen/teichoic acid export membrane protein
MTGVARPTQRAGGPGTSSLGSTQSGGAFISHMSDSSPEPMDGALRDAAVSGMRWLAVAKVVSEGLQFVAAIALARLLTPGEFGNAAVALIFVPLSVILTYEGFGSALVQRQLVDREHLQAATLLSCASGVVFSALTFLLAPVVAEPLLNHEISRLIQVVSPVFALAGVGTVPRAVLSRELDFRRLTLIETIALVSGAAVSVVLAATGLSAEAIVLGGVVSVGATSFMLVLVARPERPRWRRRELAQITRFGAPASAAGLLYVAINNATYAILAARLSSTQVGLYWRAFQLGVTYQDKISGIMMRLAFPIYSRTRDMSEMKRLHERATRIHGAVVVPLLAVLVVTAPEVVPTLFGDAWEKAVEPAQVLAVAGMIAAILTGYPQVMLAAGKPRALMIFNCFVLALYCVTIALTAHSGLVAVATAVVGVHVAMLATVYLVLFRTVLKMPIGRLVTDLAPAVAGSALIIAVGMPLAGELRDVGANAFAIIAIVGLVGAFVHLACLRSFFPAVWDDLLSLVRRLVPRVGPLRRPALSSNAS